MAHIPRSSSPSVSLAYSHGPSVADDDDGESHEFSNLSPSNTRPSVRAHANSQASLLPLKKDHPGRPRAHHHGTLRWQLDSIRKLRREGVFIGLTVLTFVMVTINFLQAFLLDHLHSLAWIVAFPLAVFILALSGIAVVAAMSREHLKKEWDDAEATERVAWVGIVVSILATIIICQFGYMPLVALPAWREIDWDDTLNITHPISFPAAVIAWINSDNNTFLSEPECTFTNDGSRSQCRTDGLNAVAGTIGQYVVFDPRNQTTPIIDNSLDGFSASVTISMGFYINSNISTNVPEFYIGFYDPTITFNLDDFMNICGDPPVYFCILPQTSTSVQLNFHAETNYLDDRIGALWQQRQSYANSTSDETCSKEVLALKKYKYYSGRYDPFLGEPLMGSDCDAAYATGDTVSLCPISIEFSMASSLLMTQTSSRGTNAKQILIDEGGIVGGITFFTWFFSIFAV